MARSPLTWLFFLFLSQASFPVLAQENSGFLELPDSILEKEHSPTKATIMSACLPGLGQAYNKKYWKIPVIYAGFGVMGYFIYTNTDEYLNYKCAYIESYNGCYEGSYSYLVNKYSTSDLLSAREYYRRNLEISCLLTAIWYALNILDATVDAHLYTFNISENLSLNMEPKVLPAGLAHTPTAGIGIKVKF